MDAYPSIFSPTKDIEKLWGTKEEVDAFENEQDMTKEEVVRYQMNFVCSFINQKILIS